MRASGFFISSTLLLLNACAAAPVEREPAASGSAVQNVVVSNPRAQLWAVVRVECLQKNIPQGEQDPCLQTDVSHGYVLFRDQKSATHDLLVPAKPVSGIEDPQILVPTAPNYFAAAWKGLDDISRTTKKDVPRDLVAAAINPVFQRSQDQLHIHIACLWPDVAQTLREHLGEFSDWDHSQVTLRGLNYRVRVLDQQDLGVTNPFFLLAANLKPGMQPMANHTLILTGARFPDGHEGFLLLDRSGPPTEPGGVHGEDLQDNDCGVLADLPKKAGS